MKSLMLGFVLVFGCLVKVLGQNGPCPTGWRAERRKLLSAVQAWNNSECYDYTYYRSCFCAPSYTGPFNVSVRNGTVVSPNNVSNIPTVPGLFALVSRLCFLKCPYTGPAKCNATYDEEGYLSVLDYDGSEQIADDEAVYTVTNFQYCG